MPSKTIRSGAGVTDIPIVHQFDKAVQGISYKMQSKHSSLKYQSILYIKTPCLRFPHELAGPQPTTGTSPPAQKLDQLGVSCSSCACSGCLTTVEVHSQACLSRQTLLPGRPQNRHPNRPQLQRQLCAQPAARCWSLQACRCCLGSSAAPAYSRSGAQLLGACIASR